MSEDFREVIDTSRLANLKAILSQEVRVAKIERPLAVQIMMATNVGVAKRDTEENEGAGQADEGIEEEKKFETKYLDPSLMKEKKKANKDAARLMKLSLTDGLN